MTNPDHQSGHYEFLIKVICAIFPSNLRFQAKDFQPFFLDVQHTFFSGILETKVKIETSWLDFMKKGFELRKKKLTLIA